MHPKAGSGAARPARSGPAPDAGLGALLRQRDFRALWAAELLSSSGDQVARVALTVLVLERTGSVAGSAAVYALTFLPALLGGLLLGWFADRFPRRAVLVGTDLLRAGLVALMALPGLHLGVVCALLVPAVLLGGPHAAARSALLPDLLPGGLLSRGIAVRQVSTQLAQVAGFGGGGLLVAAATPSGALLLDATTFAGSALLVALGVRARCAVRAVAAAEPAATGPAGPPAVTPAATPAVPPRWRPGLALVLRDPRRRYLVAAAWLAGIYVLPEALAAGYAAGLGAGPAATGALMAADPAGSVLGAAAVALVLPSRRRRGGRDGAGHDRWIVPAAVGAAVPLVLTPLLPGLWPAVLLWAASGACATVCLVHAQAGFARATPSAVRGRAVGVAAAGLLASQGIAVLLGGLLAQRTDPASALGVVGIAGVLLALGVSRLGRGAPAAGPEGDG